MGFISQDTTNELALTIVFDIKFHSMDLRKLTPTLCCYLWLPVSRRQRACIVTWHAAHAKPGTGHCSRLTKETAMPRPHLHYTLFLYAQAITRLVPTTGHQSVSSLRRQPSILLPLLRRRVTTAAVVHRDRPMAWLRCDITRDKAIV